MTLRWVPGWNGLTEPEAVSYVAAVEAADGEPLEFGVARAINDFVVGCKNDGIWDAIKASCILAGARTLNGALVPLVGAAPTNNNFVSGDYDRETGLVGNGSTKYLDSNRNNNADPQNSNHMCVYTSAFFGAGTGFRGFIGAGNNDPETNLFFNELTSQVASRSRSGPEGNTTSIGAGSITGLFGLTRNASTAYIIRANGGAYTVNRNSKTPSSFNVWVFGINRNNVLQVPTPSRLAFYSIGESLDLAKLDTRVSDLITAIGAAIP